MLANHDMRIQVLNAGVCLIQSIFSVCQVCEAITYTPDGKNVTRKFDISLPP
jgi:hypothetical protein